MARTRRPPICETPASRPGQADRTGSAGSCLKTTGTRPTGRSQDNHHGVRPDNRSDRVPARPYARSHAKPRKQGRSSIHILPADYALGADNRSSCTQDRRTAHSVHPCHAGALLPGASGSWRDAGVSCREIPVMAAMGAARAKTFLHSRYHRLARRRGKECAPVAVGNSILTIAWHLLSDHDACFADGCAVTVCLAVFGSGTRVAAGFVRSDGNGIGTTRPLRSGRRSSRS